MYTPDIFCFLKDVGNEQRYIKYTFYVILIMSSNILHVIQHINQITRTRIPCSLVCWLPDDGSNNTVALQSINNVI